MKPATRFTNTRSDSKCVYGTVARVVYSRLFPDRTRPETGRLNKSPHTLHAFANRHMNRLGVSVVAGLLTLLFWPLTVIAQSTDIARPTDISGKQVRGNIIARDD